MKNVKSFTALLYSIVAILIVVPIYMIAKLFKALFWSLLIIAVFPEECYYDDKWPWQKVSFDALMSDRNRLWDL